MAFTSAARLCLLPTFAPPCMHLILPSSSPPCNKRGKEENGVGVKSRRLSGEAKVSSDMHTRPGVAVQSSPRVGWQRQTWQTKRRASQSWSSERYGS